MIEKLVRITVAIVIAFAVFYAFQLLFGALSFGYASLALAIVGFLLIIGVCVFALREFGITL